MKYNLRKGLFLLMAILCVGWVQAQTNTIYVSPSGTDSNAGTQENPKSLTSAVSTATDGTTIQLSAGTYELASQLVIDKAITLVGEDGTIIKATAADWSTSNSYERNLISIVGGSSEGTVTLQHLIITRSKRSGINAQSAMTTVLESVKLQNNSYGAGMIVHSKVIANGITTSGNGWGGINVDKGTPEYAVSFDFDENCLFHEVYDIFSDDPSEASANYVTLPTTGNWNHGVYKTLAATEPTKGKFPYKLKRVWYDGLVTEVSDDDTGIFVYANGNRVNVTPGDDPSYTAFYIGNKNDNSSIELPVAWNLTLFGGAKNRSVANSYIYVEGNATLRNIFGGGYGELATKSQADVEGETRISLFPGHVTNLIVGGGKYYARSGQVRIFVENQSKVNWIIGGGFDAGNTTNTIETSFDKSVNRVQYSNITMRNSTANIVCVGGGQGLSYTQKGYADLEGSTITGGLLGTGSNGRSDEVLMYVNKCMFERPDGEDPIEIAAVNRGRVGSAKISFTNCEFRGTASDYYAYAGATYNWSWNGAQLSNAHEITDRVHWLFQNCGNIPFSLGLSDGLLGDMFVEGIPVQVEPFTFNASGSGITASFTVPAGKTWGFSNGIRFNNGEAVATLANQGTLNITVADIDGLKAAMQANATRVTLPEGTLTLDEQLVINKPIIIDGRADENNNPLTILTANPNAAWPKKADGSIQSSTANLISIEGNETGNVTLSKMKITGSMASGINAQSAMGIMMFNMNLTGNTNAGLLVHSNVYAYQTTISNNGWGGVNIDNGTPTYTPRFNMDESTIEEEGKPQVWSELVDTEPRFLFEEDGWRVFKDKNTDRTKDMWFWSNDELTALVLPTGCNTGYDEGEVSVFANGFPVTVYEENNQLVIETENETMTFGDKTKAGYYPVRLYGGSYMCPVSSTSITLNSGYIRNIYGGGRSDDAAMPAFVSGDANITVNGDASAVLIVGGGRYYATTATANIAFGNENNPYTGNMGTVYVGGMDQGQTTNKDNPYNEQLYYNANYVGFVNLNIYGGTFSEVACGGGNGYTHTGISNVDIKNATIDELFGASANGTADNVTVGLTNTKVVKNLSAVNRAHIGELVMFIGEDCTFGENIVTSLGATPDWADSDTNGAYIPSVKKSAFFFNGKNCPTMQVGQGLDKAEVYLSGAPALITTFNAGTPKNPVAGFQPTVKKFTIDSNGGNWTFSNGLTIAKEAEIDGNGKLSVNNSVCQVATLAQLDYVLNQDVSQIQLTEPSYNSFTVNTSAVTIDGNKAKVNGTITLGQDASSVSLKEFQFNPGEGNKAIVNTNGSEMNITHNYWGSVEPNFEALIQTTGEIAPYPYYDAASMIEDALTYQEILIKEPNQTLPKIYPGCELEIKAQGSAILTQANAQFGSVIIHEGGQLIPSYGETTGSPATADVFAFVPTLENKWKALGTPFEATLMDAELEEENEVTLSDPKADKGIWFADLVENKPEIAVKNDYTNAGLWAANNDIQYALVSNEQVSLAVEREPQSTIDGLEMVVNPNTYDITLKENVYVLSDDGSTFMLTKTPPTIKAFQSYVIADANTRATLRSIGTTDPNATANEFVVKEGYYLTTERGAIVVHTAEPMELYVVAVSGAVVYRGTVADGERIAVPTGIYAVNGQMVRVK